MDSFDTMTSLALQHGVPLQLLVDKFSHTRFEPSGFTKNPEIPMAKSIMDYIFKWLSIKFLSRESQLEAGVIKRDEEPTAAVTAAPAVEPTATKAIGNVVELATEDKRFINKIKAETRGEVRPTRVGFEEPKQKATFLHQQDAPSCSDCGSIMVRNGACYKCLNCGSTSGCS